MGIFCEVGARSVPVLSSFFVISSSLTGSLLLTVLRLGIFRPSMQAPNVCACISGNMQVQEPCKTWSLRLTESMNSSHTR